MSTTEEKAAQPMANQRRSVTRGRILLALGLLGVAALIGLWRLSVPEMVKHARVIEARAHGKFRHQLAQQIAAACRGSRCACAVRAASAGLDLDVGADVLPLADSAIKECPEAAELPGIRAEALVRLSRPEGLEAANQVLERRPNDAYARYAVALASFHTGKLIGALEALREAGDAGRGAEARLLSGLIHYNLGRLDAAEPEFAEAARMAPEDPAALYDLALVQHQRSRFAQAREGYLKVLRLNPTHADARFNLAVLAHTLGSLEEARHHLRKFAEQKPEAGRLEKLEAIIESPVIEAPKMGAGQP